MTALAAAVRELESWRDSVKGDVVGVSLTISLVIWLLGLWTEIMSRR